ncbi:Terminase small subunit [Actinobacillus pleuropneumoniae]|uniref:terminase small subunit n=1 Tax=Actinobacillus pleuropneumoniae TaxID=715 RepID=UPI0001E4A4A9|nr:terminase small subunit [Actinobacillus pleuropneumoniae]EFM88762.1 Terminase small subunit [Actinobacillus pleuropneumoniae serovar 4 str. M62]UKH41051.1 terminase small subunit [Actinobacillus pleuropneumoniae serovar 4 str. M62]SQF64585.1 Terminase small subunit [Actinobacillus pleuropneumoniae]
MAKKDEGKPMSETVGKPKLTDKQQRFVEEYLIDLNATQAAIRAGYSADTAAVIGCENLTKPNIQFAISEAQKQRCQRTQITQDEVLNRLLENIEIAMGKRKTIITIPSKNADGEMVGSEIEHFVYEPSAANKSLELLGKHLGMFKDRVDLTTNDKPLPTAINVVFSNEREDDNFPD